MPHDNCTDYEPIIIWRQTALPSPAIAALLEAAKAALALNAFYDDDPETARVSEQLRQAIAECEGYDETKN